LKIKIKFIFSNKIYATDSFSKDYAPPSNDLNFGGTNDIVLLGQEYDVGGLTTVKFRRSLDTGLTLSFSFI